ncbi:hypothetical protein ATY81_03655 [Rhizobium sp. R72]|uniref:response regulator n=1 Tax=unclassified Rhizobium TaxID=2613769 RepID=UPI000B5336C1|nr:MULTISPECIES: response regulator [unclassified Rhizobium]OWW05066.1 hypothetical protein ATY81_03655 [Rhizobium sp. R72]OWW06123.1 hypothetical protein ATY80_03655 [Rhizobium sp. R711]
MSTPADGGTERRIVLVVEDEYILAVELERALIDVGFEVLGPASSVDHALDLLSEQRPDAAVLDVTLGRETVTPVALLLKSLEVPFVLATALDASELARHAVFADVPNLGKPTDMTQLVNVVQGL